MSLHEPANPYKIGSDEAAIWEICVRRDIRSFVAADWEICAADFTTGSFSGWDARFSADPMQWKMTFPTIDDYKASWIRDARLFAGRSWQTSLADSLFGALSLLRVEVTGDTSLVHKRFSGHLLPVDGETIPLRWQSIFHLRREGGRWCQSGFIGYLPI